MAASGYRERMHLFQQLLYRTDSVDMERLRAAAFEAGIPDEHNYRSVVWKVSLVLSLPIIRITSLIHSYYSVIWDQTGQSGIRLYARSVTCTGIS